jgi:hypothetical protein
MERPSERERTAEDGAEAGGEQVWIFQANPGSFDTDDLVEGAEGDWPLRQHAERVRSGDTVLIWVCGKRPGIYALGTAVSDPVPLENTLEQQVRWSGHRSGKVPPAQVRVRYDRVFSGAPISRERLLAHEVLKNLRIVQQPRATNFEVGRDHWLALRELLE